MMLFASVRHTPSATSSHAADAWLNSSPAIIAAPAIATITVLRSKRSAIARPINGPIGAASAITLEYMRLVVTVIPCLISSVGTQFAKP
ncbi:hypothetical protein DM50_3672 [Burkholderia mallei]|nr:hypothetical protein BG19_5923 [Burkholderia pseudomallei MSHR840]KGC70997.1 hypothetical protein DM75_3362 [Burkholderia mallei]KOS85362.1 hypothetical protein DM45_2883 [Burkholderia mallei]KOT02970.1 hypothetical protein DM50_3672 [Burkholderia mallei]